jgi:hypothetical protein
MKSFNNIYHRIRETLFPQSQNLPTTDICKQFYLSLSHYLKPMRIENIDESLFYETKSAKNDWNLIKLKR